MKASKTDYLLAMLVGLQTHEAPEEVLIRVNKQLSKKRTPEQIAIDQAIEDATDKEVDEIYAIYPTKCPVSGRSTGKSSSDKGKIRALLKTMPADTIKQRMETYLSDCKEHEAYIKNFSTFLNNVPDEEVKFKIVKRKKEEPYYR